MLSDPYMRTLRKAPDDSGAFLDVPRCLGELTYTFFHDVLLIAIQDRNPCVLSKKTLGSLQAFLYVLFIRNVRTNLNLLVA